MLQISSGKFFTATDLYTTHHRGVVYTNCQIELDVETKAGSLLRSVQTGGIGSVIYAADERLEAVRKDGTREFLVSTGGEQMLQDFSAVASFDLHAVFTPDRDLASRLTHGDRLPLGLTRPPRDFVSGFFEKKVHVKPEGIAGLRSFVDELLGLERANYAAAMRAIRRYVTGLHRVGDDLEVAYTMLVASVESLAQSFDGFTPTWDDYSQAKREPIDAALKATGASLETQTQVREAVLSTEHLALSRRYREFVLAHLEPSFFRSESLEVQAAARRGDLPALLDAAYASRSGYVHSLRELPRLMTSATSTSDTLVIDGHPVLTIQGLARVARHVIRTFVRRGRKVEKEEFEYRKALPGIVTMALDESLWIHNHRGFNHRSAPGYLAGFLNQIVRILTKHPGADAVTDLSAVLAEVERQVPGLAKAEQRLPQLALYLLYNEMVQPIGKRSGWEAFVEKYLADFDVPAMESVLARLLTGREIEWSATELEQIRQGYLRKRYRKSGLWIHPILETAVTLTIAEKHRLAGDRESLILFIRHATEDFPGKPSLIELETQVASGADVEVAWRKLLLPPGEITASPAETSEGTGSSAPLAPEA